MLTVTIPLTDSSGLTEPIGLRASEAPSSDLGQTRLNTCPRGLKPTPHHMNDGGRVGTRPGHTCRERVALLLGRSGKALLVASLGQGQEGHDGGAMCRVAVREF